MNTAKLIRGMAWDHPRAINPLEAISEEWSRGRDVVVEWDARPLKDFEDQPLEDLASAYDLVLIDYPFVGTAAASGLIVAVDDWVDADYLADQAAHSAGPSYSSYHWAGKQWALAIDAACQVSAVRQDLLAAVGPVEIPGTWQEVAALALELRGASGRIAIPLNPNHSYCAFLSLGLSMMGDRFWPPGGQVNRQVAIESLEFLQRIAGNLHPASSSDDPIGISDRMADSDEILYVPLMFGYSNYSRPGFRANTLRFGDAPGGDEGHIGSVLGGVGLAMSARCTDRESASDLARTIGSARLQSGLYAVSGGQPGHATAWDSPAVNRLVGDFFAATRRTMEQAFLRPRVPGHRRFQELAGELVHGLIWRHEPGVESCLARFNELTDRLLGNWGEEGG
jgi:multiple sugar transport system substrate-binding protein